MAGRLDQLQVGEQTSRNAAVPNFQYVSRHVRVDDTERAFVDENQHGDERNVDVNSDRYNELRSLAQSFVPHRRTPGQQQDGYLGRMLFKDAFRALKDHDPLAARVFFHVEVAGYSRSQTAERMHVSKARVLNAYGDARRFLAARLAIEDADSGLAQLRAAWRAEGMEPEWDGPTLVFPIPIGPDERITETEEGWRVD